MCLDDTDILDAQMPGIAETRRVRKGDTAAGMKAFFVRAYPYERTWISILGSALNSTRLLPGRYGDSGIAIGRMCLRPHGMYASGDGNFQRGQALFCAVEDPFIGLDQTRLLSSLDFGGEHIPPLKRAIVLPERVIWACRISTSSSHCSLVKPCSCATFSAVWIMAAPAQVGLEIVHHPVFRDRLPARTVGVRPDGMRAFDIRSAIMRQQLLNKPVSTPMPA